MRRLALAAALLLAALPGAALADPRTITMTGQGEARATPDQVSIAAGVTTSAPTAAAALAANTARMQAVFAALKKLGVADRAIQTSNFSVSPQYTNGANNEPPRLTGYQVNNEVRVLLDDVARLGAALDALVGAGANQMNGISFSIRDPKPLLAQARADAVADARARAQTYARAAGVPLGAIQSISENGGGAEPPRPMYRMAAMAAAPVPVAAGEESVTASVSIVWAIP
jgi:uncharacterized protein YggE